MKFAAALSKAFGLSLLFVAASTAVISSPADPAEQNQSDAYFQQFRPLEAPAAKGLFLKEGDRLAICGDSITQQKRYSRIIEDYLTMCAPELKVGVRQYGWNGETASGFLARMTNDCLRFKPTIATLCYGMNDHRYRVYQESIGESYRSNITAVVDAFKAAGTKVILGSSGCVGYRTTWAAGAGSDDLNKSLCALRNIDVEVSRREEVRFADVFWPMLTASFAARQEYGTNYMLCGPDAVHPGWAGHTIMAYAFLKAMGFDGDIGTFTVDLEKNTMKVSSGHELMSNGAGGFEIQSSRYPFCACVSADRGAEGFPICGLDSATNSDSIGSGMMLVPFNTELNRLMLIVKNATALRYRLSWGTHSRIFTKDQLTNGINLAVEFPANPFSEQFAMVDAAIAAKQAYETTEIQKQFRIEGKKSSMSEIITQTDNVLEAAEKKHAALEDWVHSAFTPVTHVIKLEPL